MAKKINQIQEFEVDKLIPYEWNPRLNEDAIEMVANSIRDFGFRQPIIVDKDMVIIAGHTRLLAAKHLELKKMPVIIASDMNEQQVQAFRLADNKVAEYSEWDYDKLVGELEIMSSDYDWLDFSDAFPDVSDELEEFVEEIEKEKPLLKFLDYEIPLTDHERLCFTNAINKYMDNHDYLKGFVADLMQLDKQE